MQAAGECFHSFLEFSQTFTSVSINSIQTQRTSFLFLLDCDKKKDYNLLT